MENIETKITPEDFDSVFLSRKKVGSYRKIDSQHLKMLQEVFLQTPYPSKAEIKKLALAINETEKKVRDWFKSQRKRDYFTSQKVIKTYQTKQTFNKNQKKILEKTFRENKSLTPSKLIELQQLLNRTPNQIKQWFYYRQRKLGKTLLSKSTRLNECEQDQYSQKHLFTQESSLSLGNTNTLSHSSASINTDIPHNMKINAKPMNYSKFKHKNTPKEQEQNKCLPNNEKTVMTNMQVGVPTHWIKPFVFNVNPCFFNQNQNASLFLNRNQNISENPGIRPNNLPNFGRNANVQIGFGNFGSTGFGVQNNAFLQQRTNNSNVFFLLPLQMISKNTLI